MVAPESSQVFKLNNLFNYKILSLLLHRCRLLVSRACLKKFCLTLECLFTRQSLSNPQRLEWDLSLINHFLRIFYGFCALCNHRTTYYSVILHVYQFLFRIFSLSGV